MTLHNSESRRQGLSLLEVLVAMAIFLFALIVIGRLVTIGADRAVDVQFQSEAVLHCQSKMAEVVAGAVPLTSQAEVPLDEDPDWLWSMDCEQATVAGLWNVTVRVHRLRPGAEQVESTASRMILDPSLRGSSFDAALDAAANAEAAAQQESTAPATQQQPSQGTTQQGSRGGLPQGLGGAMPQGKGAPDKQGKGGPGQGKGQGKGQFGKGQGGPGQGGPGPGQGGTRQGGGPGGPGGGPGGVPGQGGPRQGGGGGPSQGQGGGQGGPRTGGGGGPGGR